MNETYTVPVVVKNEDGSCLVSFPDGLILATPGIEGAHELLDHYFGAEEAPNRRIGFTVSDENGETHVV